LIIYDQISITTPNWKIMRTQQVTVASRGSDVLGESPVWDARDGVLYWVDIREGALRRLQMSDDGPGERTRSFRLGVGLLTGVTTATGNALLIGLARGIATAGTRDLDAPDTLRPVLAAQCLAPQNRLNEIKTDPSGRIWCGAMWDYARGRSGALYRVDGTDLTCVRPHVTVPNALAFSPDGKWIYFCDSAIGVIERAPFDVESGRVGAWHELIGAAQAPGKPDGLAVDADGCLWSARFGAGCVIRFTPDGKRDTVIELPVSQPTSCAFGGDDLRTLFITTATQGLAAHDLAREPLAGSLFSVRTSASGLPLADARVPGS
jgi:sugar lactone lactonase YvrE